MAYESLDELNVFRTAERVSDRFYTLVQSWDSFPQSTLGRQLVRSADSIGANIAESYGRHHFGEKLNFLYFARGSIYETQYWVRRATARELWPLETGEKALSVLDTLAESLNALIRNYRNRRVEFQEQKRKIEERGELYRTEINDLERSLFGDAALPTDKITLPF